MNIIYSNVMKCLDQVHKVRGSIIMWTLHNKACDAFVIWILARNFDITRNHGKSSGILHKKYFLNYLIKNMKCTKITAQHRLNKAISLGFIEEEGSKYYFITGRNRIAKIAFNKQKDAYDNKVSYYRPTIFFLDDIRYTIKTKDLIDPTDINKTKSLLYGIMAVYGSRHLLSRETHAGILGHSRNTIIKLSKKSGINEIGTYLLINPISLLFQPNCTRSDAIEAFRMAEKLFRFGYIGKNRIKQTRGRVRGREILQKRRVQEVTYLVVQLPNTFTNAKIKEEIPVKFDSFMALLEPGEGASRILTSDRTQKPRQAGCPLPVGSDVDQYGGCKEKLLEGHDTFINSWELARDISLPDKLINRYLVTIRDILEDEKCRSLIMRITGAQNIKHFTSDICHVWRDKVFVSSDTLVAGVENFYNSSC